jgi:hypothetical protein
MKIILTEKQLSLISEIIINEEGGGSYRGYNISTGKKKKSKKTPGGTIINAMKDAALKAGLKLKKAVPKNSKDIKDFQIFARSKGFKNVTGKRRGALLTADGTWGPNSQAAWEKFYSIYKKPITGSSDISKVKTGDTSWLKSASDQVRRQVSYLIDNGFNEKFTVLDDKNSKVYAVNQDFSLYGVYNVITGKDRGDEVKDVTFTDWYLENPLDNTWGFLKAWYNTGSAQQAVEKLDSDYFSTKMWVKKNTPAGIFKADKSIGNWLQSKVMTAFAEKDYGKRFIGFETLNGKPIALGFHGTKNPARINITKDDWTIAVKNKGGNFSFGCVNFKDSDIQKITSFINDGQYSFWLPDSSNDIEKFPGKVPSKSWISNLDLIR